MNSHSHEDDEMEQLLTSFYRQELPKELPAFACVVRPAKPRRLLPSPTSALVGLTLSFGAALLVWNFTATRSKQAERATENVSQVSKDVPVITTPWLTESWSLEGRMSPTVGDTQRPVQFVVHSRRQPIESVVLSTSEGAFHQKTSLVVSLVKIIDSTTGDEVIVRSPELLIEWTPTKPNDPQGFTSQAVAPSRKSAEVF